MEYTPVRISTIKPMKKINFDLYIFFKEQFLCYVKNGNTISKEKHEKLKKQKITKFYITNSDEKNYQTFLDSLLDETMMSLTATTEDKMDVAEGVAANALEKLQKAPDQKTYKATVKAVKGLNELLFNDPDALKTIFSKARGDKADELISHSFNVCALAMKLATYRKCTTEEIENVGIAGLIHDIAFSNMPSDTVDLFSKPKKDLTYEDKKKYYSHIDLAGDLLKDKPFINPTILELVNNHEEVLSGNGPNKKMKLTKLEEILSLVNNYDKRILTGNLSPSEAIKEIMIDELGNYELALLNDLKAVLKHEGLID